MKKINLFEKIFFKYYKNIKNEISFKKINFKTQIYNFGNKKEKIK